MADPIPPDPDDISAAELKTWLSVDKKLIDRGIKKSVSLGWLSGTTGKVIIAVIVASVTSLVGIQGYRAVRGPGDPIPVPVAPADGFDKLAGAMSSMGEKVGGAIDKQTAVLALQPSPLPPPTPPKPAGPSIKLPAVFKAPIGRATKLTAVPSDPTITVRWLFPPTTSVNFDLVNAGTSSIAVVPLGSNSGDVGAIGTTADGKQLGPVWVTINSTSPAPPKPPDPPTPQPTDPLTSTLQTAYSQEDPAARADLAHKLAVLYSQAATTTVNDQSLKTCADLMAAFSEASSTVLGGDATKALPHIRQAIGAELSKQLPTLPSALLDASVRAKAATQFVRMANLLGALK